MRIFLLKFLTQGALLMLVLSTPARFSWGQPLSFKNESLILRADPS
jgi:hypothetical protein